MSYSMAVGHRAEDDAGGGLGRGLLAPTEW
jgi:hypothetical protein